MTSFLLGNVQVVYDVILLGDVQVVYDVILTW